MLFATFGAVWTICILCIAFAAVYMFDLHRRREDRSTYAWDAPRLWMLYALGISICYLGTARLASRLSDLLMRKLSQHPIPLLLPEQWLNLSAIFAVVAFMIGLLSRGERVDAEAPALEQDEHSLLADLRILPSPTILPEDATTYLEPANLPVPINVLDDHYPPERNLWQTLRGGLVPSLMATVGVLVLTVIAWLAFISARNTFVSADAQQIAMPEIDVSALQAAVVPGNSSLVIAARLTDIESAPIARSALAAPSANAAILIDAQGATEQAAAIGDSVSGPTLSIESATVYTSAIPISLVSATGSIAGGIAEPSPSPTARPAPTPQRASIRVPNSHQVNARFSPTVDSAIVYVLPSGSTAQIQETLPNGQWALVLLPDGRQAWVATWVVDVFDPSF